MSRFVFASANRNRNSLEARTKPTGSFYEDDMQEPYCMLPQTVELLYPNGVGWKGGWHAESSRRYTCARPDSFDRLRRVCPEVVSVWRIRAQMCSAPSLWPTHHTWGRGVVEWWGGEVVGSWGRGVVGSWVGGLVGLWGRGVVGCGSRGVVGSWGRGVVGSWGRGVVGLWGRGSFVQGQYILAVA